MFLVMKNLRIAGCLIIINFLLVSCNFSVIENNNKWYTLYQQTWSNYAVLGAYDNEIVYLKIG